jgi:twinkle protein
VSKFLRHESCPRCLSEDNVAVYEGNSKHCFTPDCGYHVFGDNDEEMMETNPKLSMEGIVSSIPDRRITQNTANKYGVTVEFSPSGEISKHYYPYYCPDTGELKGSKVRTVEGKGFHCTGNLQGTGLFAQKTCSGKGKYLTITEGELDCLAVAEMFDCKWDVVSLRSGASSAVKEIKEALEFIEGYQNVVLCFDSDKPGLAAVDAVKDLFSPQKCKICTLPMKDAGEMLKANKIKEFVNAWWSAKVYQPDGIISGVDTWEAIVKSNDVKSTPYPWNGLNEYTKGFRLGELVTITSGSGMGKSQLVRELEFYLLNATQDNIGVIALEESIARTSLGIMSIAADTPLHLEEDVDPDTLRPFWESTLGTGRYFLFDHWGSTGEDNLLSRVRYMAKALDCKWIVLDHLSIVVSSQADINDERKAIDSIMTKLRTLVQELGIGLFLVSHLRRVTGKAHEDGGKVSLSDLRGSQAIAQLSDMVIGLERDQQEEDEEKRNTTCVRVLKNRYVGITGPAAFLKYDRFTGRMSEVAKPKEAESDF